MLRRMPATGQYLNSIMFGDKVAFINHLRQPTSSTLCRTINRYLWETLLERRNTVRVIRMVVREQQRINGEMLFFQQVKQLVGFRQINDEQR